MKTIVEGISQEPDVALVRVWFLAPGDICAECYVRPECPDQTCCLHLVASAGHSLQHREDWSCLTRGFCSGVACAKASTWRGSKPARFPERELRHQGRAEFFALPTLARL